jgi:hypothetical protein
MRLLLVMIIFAAVYLAASLGRWLFPGIHPYQMDWWHFAFYEVVVVLFMVVWGIIRVKRNQAKQRAST